MLQLTVITITDTIKLHASGFDKVLVCGGGANNPLLMKNIQELLGDLMEVTTTSDFGLSPDCIEAVAFAWLAKKRLENKPTNISAVTGANKNAVLGGTYTPS